MMTFIFLFASAWEKQTKEWGNEHPHRFHFFSRSKILFKGLHRYFTFSKCSVHYYRSSFRNGGCANCFSAQKKSQGKVNKSVKEGTPSRFNKET
jgi:hypothetical protein